MVVRRPTSRRCSTSRTAARTSFACRGVRQQTQSVLLQAVIVPPRAVLDAVALVVQSVNGVAVAAPSQPAKGGFLRRRGNPAVPAAAAGRRRPTRSSISSRVSACTSPSPASATSRERTRWRWPTHCGPQRPVGHAPLSSLLAAEPSSFPTTDRSGRSSTATSRPWRRSPTGWPRAWRVGASSSTDARFGRGCRWRRSRSRRPRRIWRTSWPLSTHSGERPGRSNGSRWSSRRSRRRWRCRRSCIGSRSGLS